MNDFLNEMNEYEEMLRNVHFDLSELLKERLNKHSTTKQCKEVKEAMNKISEGLDELEDYLMIKKAL